MACRRRSSRPRRSATQAGNKQVSTFSDKLKTAGGKVKSKFSDGLNKTKAEMDAHATKVQGGTQKIPGDNQAKISEGKAKVNAEAQKEPEKKEGGLWGAIKSAASWVAEKLKAAFEFVTKLLTDPGFWVSLVVAIAMTAFVIATFGTGLAVLAIGGVIIGAISAGAGQIISNLAAGQKWNEGLGTAMLIGGAFGLIPGAGRLLGAAGSRIAGTALGRFASSGFSRIASSAFGRGVSAMGSRLGSVFTRAASSRVGQVVSAPFRAVANAGTRAGTAVRNGFNRLTGRGGSVADDAVRSGGTVADDAARGGTSTADDAPAAVNRSRRARAR